MSGARTRIGRVTMKAGGADVRVLHVAPSGPVIARIHKFAQDCSGYQDPPSAFVVIAFWPSDGEPWRPSYLVDWMTRDQDLPLPRLMRQASEQIAVRGTVDIAVDEARSSLGYRRPPEGKT